MLLSRKTLVVICFLIAVPLARHVWNGQVEWLSGPDEGEIRDHVARTASAEGYDSLTRLLPDEAAWLRDEVRRLMRLERGGVVVSTAARELVADIRRRNAGALLQAPDELNRKLIRRHSRWVAAVSDDADLCGRVISLGEQGVLLERLDDIADAEMRDDAVIYEAMHAGLTSPAGRSIPSDEDWPGLIEAMIGNGLARSDLALLAPEGARMPETCGAMARYLDAAAVLDAPLAEGARAIIARGLMAL